jgi:hypothetical protein
MEMSEHSGEQRLGVLTLDDGTGSTLDPETSRS